MLEGPFAEQNSREVELKEFVEPALMGQVLHFLYFRNGELLPYLFDAKLRPSLVLPGYHSTRFPIPILAYHCHKFTSVGSLNIILTYSPFLDFIFYVV